MTVISNSSPLIALSRVGKISVLRDLFGKVYIPDTKECRNEILALNPAGSAKISFRHSFESISYFCGKMKDANKYLGSKSK